MSELQLFNTITKKLENFVPIEGNKVKIYICGPTVYDSPHIGHARTYISFDVIRRVLADYFKYDVTFVMNITNIDDKIIKRAAERNMSCEELGKIYEDEFLDEMAKLNVKRPDFITRVTEYVSEIIEFIKRLEKNGLTYASNGSVYFNLKAYKKDFKYNVLRGYTTKEEDEETEKNFKDDFVLWKASKGNDPSYESPWGPGRPGWHIECSVMAASVLGERLDIHAGGIDLAFPHHENEMAQCQGCFKNNWINVFLHTGHLNIDGLKMSKSLKNFLTIKEIVDASSPLHLRILFLQHYWNKEMNYDPDQLKEADAILKKILNFVSNSESIIKRNDIRPLNELDRRHMKLLDDTKDSIDEALKNNIDTPKALSAILELISEVNKDIRTVHTDVLRMVLNFVLKILNIFGIHDSSKSAEAVSDEKVAEFLNEFRNKVRQALKSKSDTRAFYQMCDEVRDGIKQFGYIIDDLPDGSILRRSK